MLAAGLAAVCCLAAWAPAVWADDAVDLVLQVTPGVAGGSGVAPTRSSGPPSPTESDAGGPTASQ
ncbi:MAG: hypothetical protein LBG60_13955 [Bifidobacteriaceae bacterium]|nr:hypothetical protein [Bifidobacteriaceae bacterium]